MALKSFGKVTVTSAGSKVRCTINQTDPTARVGLQSFSVYAPAGNVGDVYVGIGSTFSTSTYSNLLGIIPKGQWWSGVINLAPAGVNLADYYIDAVNSNDSVLVVGTEQ